MTDRFASGKHAIAECDRCGFRFKLKQLRKLVLKTKNTNIMVCDDCYESDHPQLMHGMYPVNDPQALREPRPDITLSYSRNIQWGWNPVGFGSSELTPNNLLGRTSVGIVNVEIT